ncbi:MAG: Flp pilus assembly protein CpaB [Candidatus Eisenbacteria bacterium]
MNTNQGKQLMFVALILGAAAAVAGYYGLTSMASKAAASNDKNYKNVVVTATDLTFGVKLDRTQLRIARYPKDAVPEGAYASMDSVVGQTTKVFMSAREPVTAIKLSSRGGGLSMLVRTSMRAASLEVNQVSGVSGFVLPGDRVDVICTVEPRTNLDDAITRTILQNIEVLAAGQKTEQQDNKPITVQSVTLLVDPNGAEALALAEHEGKIHLVLRNPGDNDQTEVASLSTDEMLGQRKVPATTDAAPAPRHSYRRSNTARAVASPSGPKPNVRIIRSASVTETPAVSDSAKN